MTANTRIPWFCWGVGTECAWKYCRGDQAMYDRLRGNRLQAGAWLSESQFFFGISKATFEGAWKVGLPRVDFEAFDPNSQRVDWRRYQKDFDDSLVGIEALPAASLSWSESSLFITNQGSMSIRSKACLAERLLSRAYSNFNSKRSRCSRAPVFCSKLESTRLGNSIPGGNKILSANFIPAQSFWSENTGFIFMSFRGFNPR